MSRKINKKRPCSICRKWFLPDVRQIDRQKTCSPACRHERHRRQCGKCNRKNKQSSKGNYLGDKIEKVLALSSGNPKDDPKPVSLKSLPKPRLESVVPRDIVLTQFGPRWLILIDYISEQIHQRNKSESMKNVLPKDGRYPLPRPD
jgi:hypothetical protein